jgi:glycosyltransferase involved in cell wall biosynthesis
VAAISAELPWSPSLRVRTVLPAAALARHGVQVAPLLLFEEDEARRFEAGSPATKAALALGARRRLRRRIDRADAGTALVHRRADLLPSLALERAAARGGRLVYDVDDAIWLDARHGSGSGSHPLAFLKGSARKVRWLAGNADAVIAGNALLAEHLEGLGAAVTVIPSLVDTDGIAPRRHADAPELVLGWVGSRSTAPFLAAVGPALSRVAAALPGVRLRLLVVGGSADPVPGVELEAVPWSEAAQADALARMDVGLMPLPDTPWTRGKCAYKALQYMAAGVPVVADDVGIANTVVGDTAGYVVGTPEDWADALLAVLQDPALRERLGRAGRERVQRDFSLERWAPVLADVLRGAPARQRRGGTESQTR